jgi:putative peptidoglycan lipid II flippase
MKVAKPTLAVTLVLIGAAALGAWSDVLLAATYGAGRIVDAFVTALFIPLLLQEFVMGDSFSRVFIPAFSGFLVRGEHEEGQRVASSVITALALFFGAVVILALLAAPLLVAVVVPGFDASDQALTTTLTRIVMPVVLCTVLVSAMSSLLNAYQRFVFPALAQVVYQALLILAIVTLGRWYGVAGLAVGVALTGVGQVLFLLPQVRKQGFVYRPVLDLKHPVVRQMGRLVVPLILRLIVAQSFLVAERMIASGLSEGSIAAMTYARKLFQLAPLTFAVALNAVLFPTLARYAAAGQLAALGRALVRGLRALLLVMAPLAALLIVLASPLVSLVFERGAFDGQARETTAGVLTFLALGLFSLPAMWLVSLGFFALRDTTTPLWITLGLTAPVIALDLLLVGPLGVNGLALGTTALRTLQFVLSFALLRRKIAREQGQALPLRHLLDGGARILLASGAMVTVIVALAPVVQRVLDVADGRAAGLPLQVAYLAAMSALGLGVYALVLALLRVEELGLLMDAARRMSAAGIARLQRRRNAPSPYGS